MKALGEVALVCRTWREVATWDGLWKGIEDEVKPVLWEEEDMEQEGGGRRAVGRARLVQYGRMLAQERRVWSEDDWAIDLVLHVEIFDRHHGLQMLSARGPLTCEVKVADNAVVVGFPDLGTPDVRASSFSQNSMHLEWVHGGIWWYFRGHSSLCVRVTVRDQQSGKEGLLWEERFDTVRDCEDPVPYWEARLPQGSQAVISRARRMVGGAGDGLECYTEFLVCPEPDQAGVAERNRQYRVATRGDGDYGDDYPFSLKFKGTDIARVRTVIRALC